MGPYLNPIEARLASRSAGAATANSPSYRCPDHEALFDGRPALLMIARAPVELLDHRRPPTISSFFAQPDRGLTSLAAHLGRLAPASGVTRKNRAREQIAQRTAPAQRHPDPPAVFRPVMQHMAALAERPDVAVPAPAVGRIVVQMCGRQHDLRRADRLIPARRGGPTAVPIPPSLFHLVPPAAIAQVLHGIAMRSTTGLAITTGPDETDPVADLRPVDRVEVAQLRLDRHGLFRLRLRSGGTRRRRRPAPACPADRGRWLMRRRRSRWRLGRHGGRVGAACRRPSCRRC